MHSVYIYIKTHTNTFLYIHMLFAFGIYSRFLLSYFVGLATSKILWVPGNLLRL